MTTRLEVTTNRGLEELVVQEFTELAAAEGVAVVTSELRPSGLAGWLAIEADAPTALLDRLATDLRSAHHVIRHLHAFDLASPHPLRHIRSIMTTLTIPELQAEGVRFRVTSRRTGEHPFTSEDVQREAGAGIRKRTRRAVSMKDHDVNVRVDVRAQRCLVGLQLTRESLSARHLRPFLPPVALRANVAWALLRLARPEKHSPPRRLLDPFCGGGTLLLEAGAVWPGVALAASDISPRCVDGTRANLAANALHGDVRVGDASELATVWEGERFDTVVSNTPFGKRIGAGMSFERLFHELLRGLAEITTPEARVVLLLSKRAAFNRALDAQAAFALRHARIVEVGGLHPCAVMLERT